MTAFLLGLLPTIWPYALLLLGAVGTFFYGRHGGVKSERAKQAQAELRARHKADEVEDAIAGRSAEDNRGRLGKWARR